MSTPTLPATTPTAHHPLGPSQYPMWAECPCFTGTKDDNPNDAKSRGTAQHEAHAKAILGQPEPFADLDDTEEEQARWVAEKVIERAASAGYTPSDIQVENRLTMFKADGFEVLYFGTGDIEFGPYLFDAKYGDERNYFAQMCGYALPKMDKDGIDKVFVSILYGRSKRVVSYVIDRETAERVVYSILAKQANPNKQPKACEYCSWCAHKLSCPAINAQINTVLAKRDDWAVRLPTMSASEAGADPVMIGAMKWIWKQYIEDWGKSVDYAAACLATQGVIPLGFKKQDEKGSLVISDGAKAYQALITAGIEPEKLLAAFAPSMKAMAEAYASSMGVSAKVAAVKVEEALVKAGAAARGDAKFKLICKSDAEDDIRAALARPAQTLPLQ